MPYFQEIVNDSLTVSKKSGERKRLEWVKKYLDDLEIFLSLKCLHSITKDLKTAMTCSQSDSFGRKELLLVADARSSLECAVEVCQDLLKPPAEYVDDEDYTRVSALVLESIIEGVAGALKKWDSRVHPTMQLFNDIEEMKPANWVSDIFSMPLHVSESVLRYGNLKEGAIGECHMEWRKYKKIMKELSETMKNATEARDEDAVSDVNSRVDDACKFWEAYSSRLPLLSRVASNILALCPSGAEVERSFKKLRMILPKDHQRDQINEAMLRVEMFMSFNKHHLTLFQ